MKLKIEPYKQNIIKKLITSINELSPVCLVGMHDVGLGYVFSSLMQEVSVYFEDYKILFIDLAGTNTNFSKEIDAIWNEFDEKDRNSLKRKNVSEYLIKEVQTKKIVFAMFIDETGEVSKDLLDLFIKLRRVGAAINFSYIIFSYTNFINNKIFEDPIYNKLVHRDVIPLLPLDRTNSFEVMDIFVNLYSKKKIANTKKTKIYNLAGGNDGLMKAIFLLESKDKEWEQNLWGSVDIQYRLQKITDDLSLSELDLCIKLAKGQNYLKNRSFKKLVKFGYIYKNRLFSPLWKKYLLENYKTEHESLLLFTKSERSILRAFYSHPGELITRDAIAENVWGDNWSADYSDWAIDQNIHRIRKKLKKHKLGSLKTKKGEGYIFSEGI